VKLADYEPIVGKSTIEELSLLASKLAGREVQNINSTFVGGGVAEILTRMVPILQELGIDARWSVVKGSPGFYEVTKKFHNALHGRKESISEEDFDLFLTVNRKNMAEMDVHGQIMFIHDPQPCALIEMKKNLGGKWI